VSLSTFGYPLTNFSTGEHPSQFVFVTAAGNRHLHVCMDAVARIQSFFPQHLVYVYDLSDGGLLTKNSDKVSMSRFVITLCRCYMHYASYWKLTMQLPKFPALWKG